MFKNEEVFRARERIGDKIISTPCVKSLFLSELLGAEIFLKLENLHRTGSFKERGALNFLLTHDCKGKRVVAASAGNHALALARHASALGVSATIFMPKNTPSIKVLQTKKFGAEVRLTGANYDDAFQSAQQYCDEIRGKYVHAYNDRDVIVGQATISHEIVSEIGIPDLVFVPVGGGGLISGIGTFLKNAKASTQVVGIEARGFNSMAEALKQGGPTVVSNGRSIAEGIAVKRVGQLTYEACKEIHPVLKTVEDVEIQSAIMLLLEKQKIVTEGAGAAAVAGILAHGKELDLQKKKVVVIISGGNIDLGLLSRLTILGMIRSKRLCKLSLVIDDCPGSLSRLLDTLAESGVNIVDVQHERYFVDLSWNEVRVNLIVETKDEIHEEEAIKLVEGHGYSVSVNRLGA